MSSPEDSEQGTKYEFKGEFGEPLALHPPAEVTQFEVDAFVRHILGLTKDREMDSTTTKS